MFSSTPWSEPTMGEPESGSEQRPGEGDGEVDDRVAVVLGVVGRLGVQEWVFDHLDDDLDG